MIPVFLDETAEISVFTPFSDKIKMATTKAFTVDRPQGSSASARSESFLCKWILTSPTAAMLAGLLEVTIFHPVDTMSKRLMSHEKRVLVGSVSESLKNVGTVIKGSIPPNANGAATSWVQVIRYLYSGTQYAVLYKVSQRTIKFAGQPVVKDYLHSYHEGTFNRFCGKKKGKQLMEATAGSIVGVCEVVVLPFDRMKVLLQTNRGALQSRGLLQVARHEGVRKLYAGAGTTALRNLPGSFLLFGGAALTKDVVFGLEDHRKATFFQNTVASTVGACMGVFCTSPLDVIKTRIQNKGFDQAAMSGAQVFRHVVKTEGASAFFKGITPKVIATSPKLVFTYTMTEFFVGAFKRFKE